MKKLKSKKLIFLIFILQIWIFSMPASSKKVYAASNVSGQAVEVFTSNLCNSEKVEESYTIDKNYTLNNNMFYSLDDAVKYLRSEMVNRNEKITFTVKQYYHNNFSKEILDMALDDNDSLPPNEGDYLKKHFDEASCEITYNTSGITTLSYNIKYLTSYSQEMQVDKELENVLNYLNVYYEDDYTKVKAVHDYIVKNIKYDESLTKYSAYNALIEKSVVCQGYSSLTYRMLKELGMGVRVITGVSGKGVSHAWNIVCVDGKWYNLDNTWDADLSSNDFVSYEYFLKNEKDFPGHIRDSDYLTTEFCNGYPVSEVSYTKLDNSLLYIYANEDVNRDEKVDELDLAAIAFRYNSNPSDLNWNSRYDINNDNIVDIYDICIISSTLNA